MGILAVVVPMYNRWDLTHARLYELYQFVSDGIEIILIDDASPEENEIKSGIAWWQKQVKKHPIHYYRNKENLGFGGSLNVGARIAFEKTKAEAVALLSNDVIVRGDFISPIKKMLEEKPNSLIGGRIVYWDSGWNTFNFDGKLTTIPYCEGWLLACTKDAWKEIGGFDLLYSPYDMEDIDLSLTATRKGYELIALNSPYLKHISGATIVDVNPNRMAISERNKQRFYEKWKARWNDPIVEVEIADG